MTPFLFVKMTDIVGLELTWTSFGVPSTTSSLLPTMTLTMFCCSLIQTLPILVQNLRIDLVTTAPMNVPGSIPTLPGLVYCLVETSGWKLIWSSSWINFTKGWRRKRQWTSTSFNTFKNHRTSFFVANEDIYLFTFMFASCDATCHQTFDGQWCDWFSFDGRWYYWLIVFQCTIILYKRFLSVLSLENQG